MLQKAREPTHGGHKTIVERWQKDDKYRTSLSEIGWTEEQIFQYDKLALEDHRFSATRKERDRYESMCVLKLNEEGAQAPWTRRLDYVEAKREMERLHDEHVKKTSEGSVPIHPSQRLRQPRGQKFEGLKQHNYRVDPQTGRRFYPTKSQGHLARQTLSSSSTNWEHQNTWTTRSWDWQTSSWSDNS